MKRILCKYLNGIYRFSILDDENEVSYPLAFTTTVDAKAKNYAERLGKLLNCSVTYRTPYKQAQ